MKNNNNTRLLNFKGHFDIQYVPEENLSKYNTYYRIPITIKITLGDQTLGLNGTEYQSVGYRFCPSEYLRKVISIQNGEKKRINLHERYPVPITFSPLDEYCLVHLEKDQIGSYASFHKNKIKDQVVSLDKTVFKLANVINNFLLDLDKRGLYSLLDELESELNPLINRPELKNVFLNQQSELYQFKTEQSIQRTLDSLTSKQKIHKDYSKFLNSLSNKQLIYWNNILKGLRNTDLTKSDNELYSSFRT